MMSEEASYIGKRTGQCAREYCEMAVCKDDATNVIVTGNGILVSVKCLGGDLVQIAGSGRLYSGNWWTTGYTCRLSGCILLGGAFLSR